MRPRMKFSQRLVAICVIGSLTLIYFLLSYTGYLTFSDHSQKLDDFFADNPLVFSFQSAKSDQSQCRTDFTVQEDVITTLDLAEKTNYNSRSDGQYELPHPSIDKLAYGSKVEHLTVIIVPHSHVDPGWLQTVDEYYSQKVKHILNNMVKKLHLYEDMTFIWAEMVYFTRWWNEQNPLIQDQVVKLVHEGRLEFALGGWVMPDEATTTYQSVISQLIEGHHWLQEVFGIAPNNSWSIDPFGHSGTMPYIWREAGMQNMVIQRIHQATKASLIRERSLDFNWRQFWDQSGKTDIQCHVMPYMLYGSHHTCGPDKFVCAMFDFKQVDGDRAYRQIQPISKENIDQKAQELYKQYRLKSGLSDFNTILVPLGDDFRYNYGQEWDQQYENYHKLMDYMHGRKDWNITLKFGTLNDYFSLIKQNRMKKKETLSTLSGDFFPYSDEKSSYWTGYYTTRPFDKRFSREVEARLKTAEIFSALALSYSAKWEKPYSELYKVFGKLKESRENLGLFLHHDAITGTAKANVVQDYEDKLQTSFIQSQSVLEEAVQFLLTKGKVNSYPVFQAEMFRDEPRVSSMHRVIKPTKEGVRVVMVNPTGQFRSEFVELIVNSVEIEIKNSKLQALPFQINPVFSSKTEVDRKTFEIVFLSEISPFGMETYILKTIHRTPKSFWSKLSVFNTNELIVAPELRFDQILPRRRGNMYESIHIENDQISAEFTSFNGMLSGVTDKKTKEKTDIMLEFKHYISRGSGAYIFFPSSPARDLLLGSPVIHVIEGPFMSEVQVIFPLLYHKVRIYNHPGLQGRSVHIQNALDMYALNMRDREVIMRMSTSLGTDLGTFYTDENGFQLIGRRKHPSDIERQNIERNYYPMTSMAFLQHKHSRVTLHSAQSHGVASLDRGCMEVMLDRQLLYDDERGLGEGIFDNKLTMMKYVLQVEHSETLLKDEQFIYPSLESVAMNTFLQEPMQKLYSQINSDVFSLKFSPISHSLPCDTTLVSLKSMFNTHLKYNGTSLILHRRGYMCGFPDNGLQCDVKEINVQELFPGIGGADVTETSLTHLERKPGRVNLENLKVPPMEIKSYIVNTKQYSKKP